MPDSATNHILEAVNQAQRNWEQQNTPERIEAEISKILEHQKIKAIRYFLGFKDDPWSNKWTFNSQADSPLRDHINASVKASAMTFLQSIDGLSFRPTKAMTESYWRTYQKAFDNCLESHIVAMAQDAAGEAFEELKNRIKNNDPVEKYNELLNLVTPKSGKE